MFFILSKLSYYFLSPLFWILILAILAWKINNSKQKKVLRWTTICCIYFFTQTIILSELYRLWDTQPKPFSEVKNHEIGIVLSGMAQYNHYTNSLQINKSGDRIWQALNLYHAKKIQKILISGDSGSISDDGLHEAQQMKTILVKWGIPSDHIIIETKSRNTVENARETKALLQKLKLFPTNKNKALLITSGLHMKRAKAVFDKAQIPVDCFSTDSALSDERNYSFSDFLLPSFELFHPWTNIIKEWIGYIAYSAMGYL
jgi:uncharacterized SAM-binding protein YcdF (DUF218 family)